MTLPPPGRRLTAVRPADLVNNADPNGPWADALPSWRHQAATHANYATFNPSLTAQNG